jgi:hypothetical protein
MPTSLPSGMRRWPFAVIVTPSAQPSRRRAIRGFHTSKPNTVVMRLSNRLAVQKSPPKNPI